MVFAVPAEPPSIQFAHATLRVAGVCLPHSLVPFELTQVPGALFVIDYEDRTGARITSTYAQVRHPLPSAHYASLLRDGWTGFSALVAVNRRELTDAEGRALAHELAKLLAGRPLALKMVADPVPFDVPTPFDSSDFATFRVRLRIEPRALGLAATQAPGLAYA